jgi:hypothetical protein
MTARRWILSTRRLPALGTGLHALIYGFSYLSFRTDKCVRA